MATEVKNELAQLKGIGKKRLALLGEENIFSLEDLVHFFPRRYDAFQEGENTCSSRPIYLLSLALPKSHQQFRR